MTTASMDQYANNSILPAPLPPLIYNIMLSPMNNSSGSKQSNEKTFWDL